MNFYFYCPECKKSDDKFNGKEYERSNKITYSNPRDGYGRHITHIICPECGYELSGFINYTSMFIEDDIHSSKDCFEYLKDTITGYSNGFYCDSKKLLKLIREDIKKRNDEHSNK
jgi:rubredoxin